MAQPENIRARKQWSIMVYMAGGSNVSDAARDSLLRMKEVGSTEDFHVIAQFDSGSEGMSTKRYYLTRFDEAAEAQKLLKMPGHIVSGASLAAIPKWSALKDASAKFLEDKLEREEIQEQLKRDPDWIKTLILDSILDSDKVIDLGSTNARDPEALKNFIAWGIERYPANHTMVIIWGLDSGSSVAWDVSPSKTIGTMAKRMDQDVGMVKDQGVATDADLVEHAQLDSIAASDLKKAFELKRNIDIVGFDGCLMDVVDVYYQLSGIVDCGVASEGLMPSASWPYQKILGTLQRMPQMSPREFAKIIVDEYERSFGDEYEDDQEKAVDIFACDLSSTHEVVGAVRALVELLLEELRQHDSQRAVLNALMATHLVVNSNYADLYDFCELMRKFCGRTAQECQNVMSTIERMVLKGSHLGDPVENAHGLLIYLPREEGEVFRKDKSLFVYQTGLQEFVQLYLKRLTESRGRPAARTSRLTTQQLLDELKKSNDEKFPTQQVSIVELQAVLQGLVNSLRWAVLACGIEHQRSRSFETLITDDHFCSRWVGRQEITDRISSSSGLDEEMSRFSLRTIEKVVDLLLEKEGHTKVDRIGRITLLTPRAYKIELAKELKLTKSSAPGEAAFTHTSLAAGGAA